MIDQVDFEAALRADLIATERSAPAPHDLATRLLDDVLSRPRPKRDVPRWVWPAVAAALVAAVIVAAVIVAVRGNPFTSHGAQPAQPGGSIQVTGVHFVDAQNGWAAGTSRCSQHICSIVIARTTDGGLTWTNVRPRAQVGTTPSTGTCAGDCMPDVIFAGDGRHGFLTSWRWSMLYATSDGGQTWTSEPSKSTTMQLVVSGPNAVRLVSPSTSGDQLLVAPLGGSQWRNVTPWNFSATDVTLAAAGPSVYAFVVGPEYAWLYRSTDGGASWTHVRSTYLQHTPKTYDQGPLATWTFAVVSDGAVVVARFANGHAPTLRVSTDGGATFGPERDLAVPPGVRPGGLSGTALAAASADDLLETAQAHGTAYYFVSSDGGSHWRATRHGPAQSGLPDISWAFPSRDFGVRVADNGLGIDVTTDQGRTETVRAVR